ncbi:MAG: hypothetical protein OHK93_007323 [Ramalina farinacea]|uniref:Uncharacterized protein n=1 Tax=Ramalina farinacea TaxID=258253 RepID=A0AA43QLZ6_9LECA|nr:hypothetical protein [Ramalina farinacea]
MEPYRYNRLQRPEGQLQDFRFFTLFHGSFDDEIRVKIEVRPIVRCVLSDKQKVETDFPWSALSYTWGDATDPSRVTVVSGNDGDNYITVTRDFEDALRHVRSAWADMALVHVLEAVKLKERSEQESWRELAMLFFDKSDSVAAHVAIGHASSVLCSVPPLLNAIKPDIESITAEIKQYMTYLYGEAPRLYQDHRRLLKLPKDVLSHVGSKNLAASVRILRERRAPLLFLPNGYIGLGPTGVKLNDEIWAMLGSQALMVLREVWSKNNYELVGPCSIHGFNSGEAILGPLPEQYTVVPHLLDSEGYFELHYLDTTTGKASEWDPRIAWAELEAQPPMNDSRFIWAPYGEPPRLRPDSEYLRRHNINIEYIDLV